MLETEGDVLETEREVRKSNKNPHVSHRLLIKTHRKTETQPNTPIKPYKNRLQAIFIAKIPKDTQKQKKCPQPPFFPVFFLKSIYEQN